jgi:predicted RNA-binding Zn ribbon-like protein
MAFVNTVTGRDTDSPVETLTSYAALVTWARSAGAVSAGTAVELERAAAQRPSEARRVLAEALDLRECLHALFSAIDGRKPLAPAVLQALSGHLGAGYSQARLVFHDKTLRWAPGTVAGLADITHELARAAARLVESSQLAHVRACAADNCRWWFVDETKNHSRRWCDMKLCGNRAKVRRFRARA